MEKDFGYTGVYEEIQQVLAAKDCNEVCEIQIFSEEKEDKTLQEKYDYLSSKFEDLKQEYYLLLDKVFAIRNEKTGFYETKFSFTPSITQYLEQRSEHELHAHTLDEFEQRQTFELRKKLKKY